MEKNTLYLLFKDVIKEHFRRKEKLLGDLKLHRGQAPVLLLLGEKDGLVQKEISERLKIKPSTVTLIIKRMEKRGLVFSKRDEKDKRFSKIYLTEDGRKFICKLKKTFGQLEEEMFSGFSEEEKIILEGYLRRIQDNLEKINKER
ncbi:MAG TPA: MarR family transcriptional regulator [Dictyoglomaceae bacterium]|nr:MarR family transcriptional regulator [Dictyoglomaceae bacterium]HOL39946.1 MarR family transcriptional regulator [Dictyoglomaceae bacterium]HPP16408.1 MarR family transcriptional regulator [Dictyoglomaceae bacterium]HPU43625.1 MarR family transcriptional regulator [Dictyoglomaceae bacterium]